MLIVGDPPARMCKAGDVSLTLTLLKKEGFEKRIELFEYRDKLTDSIRTFFYLTATLYVL